jgi:hypothetical protein
LALMTSCVDGPLSNQTNKMRQNQVLSDEARSADREYRLEQLTCLRHAEKCHMFSSGAINV